jgi:hypothetical protein
MESPVVAMYGRRNGAHSEGNVKIDIDRLSEEELVDLNNRIVARLRFLRDMRAHSEMLDFKIGDRVEFQPDIDQPIVAF